MSRRTKNRAAKGQVYCVEVIEWKVCCAQEGCEAKAVVAPLGEVSTAHEAEQRARRDASAEDLEISGWKRAKGLWRCPEHGEA